MFEDFRVVARDIVDPRWWAPLVLALTCSAAFGWTLGRRSGRESERRKFKAISEGPPKPSDSPDPNIP